MVQRHGMTPLEWLESIDFLSEWSILGHVIFIAGHSWVRFAGDDLSILTRHGASVAHATCVFARRSFAMVAVRADTQVCPYTLDPLYIKAVSRRVASRQNR